MYNNAVFIGYLKTGDFSYDRFTTKLRQQNSFSCDVFVLCFNSKKISLNTLFSLILNAIVCSYGANRLFE